MLLAGIYFPDWNDVLTDIVLTLIYANVLYWVLFRHCGPIATFVALIVGIAAINFCFAPYSFPYALAKFADGTIYHAISAGFDPHNPLWEITIDFELRRFSSRSFLGMTIAVIFWGITKLYLNRSAERLNTITS